MATDPKKPQGGPKGGKFVDPLDKWEESIPDFKDAQAEDAKNKKRTMGGMDVKKLAESLAGKPDEAALKIAELLRTLANPKLSTAERISLKAELRNARQTFLKLSEASNKISKELGETRRLEAAAYSRLSRLKTFQANADKRAYSKQDLKKVEDTQKKLEQLTDYLAKLRNSPENEEFKKAAANKLDELVKEMEDLPKEMRELFKEDDNKLDAIIKNQLEAREFVKAQNAAISKAMWKMADKMGFGAINIGNLIRGGMAVWNAPKAAKARYQAVKNKINAGRDYINKTVEMRRLAKADITEQVLDDGEDKEARKQTSLMQRYVESSDRFKSRILARWGKKDDKKKEEDKSWFEDVKAFFGAGGFLRTLLGLAGKLSAIGIAGAVGYWIGSKVWEKIAPSVGKMFNNISGLDEAGRNATRPSILNTQDNFNKAQQIHQSLQRAGSKVSRSDQDWYADFRTDNAKVNLDAAYAPNAALKAINARNAKATGSVDTVPGQSGAGAGRGSINPPMVQPVNSGSPTVSDWKSTVTTTGNADVDGLAPDMKANLAGMAQEYYERTGKKLNITSAFRSMKEQADLYKNKPPGMAAPPGSSLHNFGYAVDISSANANELHNLGLLEKYGFVRPISSEKWHVQPAGVTLAAAKSGIYSADAPSDQGGTAMAQASPAAQTVPSAEARIPVQTAGGGGVSSGSGGSVDTIGGGKTTVADIPIFDNTDGHLLAMNLGVV